VRGSVPRGAAAWKKRGRRRRLCHGPASARKPVFWLEISSKSGTKVRRGHGPASSANCDGLLGLGSENRDKGAATRLMSRTSLFLETPDNIGWNRCFRGQGVTHQSRRAQGD